MFLILLVLIVLAVGGYFGGNAYRPGYGPGIGLGTVLVILLIIYLMGGFGRFRW